MPPMLLLSAVACGLSMSVTGLAGCGVALAALPGASAERPPAEKRGGKGQGRAGLAGKGREGSAGEVGLGPAGGLFACSGGRPPV